MISNKILKARLLCEGARASKEVSEAVLRCQNPFGVRRGGLSSGAKVRLLPAGPKVNFPLYIRTETSISVVMEGQRLVFIEQGSRIGQAEILDPPSWYGQVLTDGTPIEQILTDHGGQLAGAVYEDCILFSTGRPCSFCVMQFSACDKKLRLKRPQQFIEALNFIPRGERMALVLNGGMTLHEGRGIELIVPVVREIRRVFPDLPIAVEITPPWNLEWVRHLKDAGCDSLMMNLECWDREARKKFIPGKNVACPRDLYLTAFKEAVRVFGIGRVTSCFVLGLEDIKSLKEGILTIIEYGVIPSPLAGRGFEDIKGYNFVQRVSYQELLDVVQFTRQGLQRREIVSTDKAGCVACGMCDMVCNLS